MGNIKSAGRRRSSTAVHPHVCGEHFPPPYSASPCFGSSPRVWGTFDIKMPEVKITRFIPTCVGNITCRPAESNPKAVHPHVCGEHPSTHGNRSGRDGSSPRVWGTSPHSHASTETARFIPTCVGNICPVRGFNRFQPVHPHVCGEH